ncbi:TIR domain-containing protein [Candidatus Magnetaquicoccus inordinatus]|uniref:TIR domain-containing protein n=1 Tax=Candidatus Magnetaquicoccus inordinatus TaxID=2496818 RepID=UPI00187D5FC3|nr:TIR domain-containing protein [Candidatus Magnetaquicoccus inordinatus]
MNWSQDFFGSQVFSVLHWFVSSDRLLVGGCAAFARGRWVAAIGYGPDGGHAIALVSLVGKWVGGSEFIVLFVGKENGMPVAFLSHSSKDKAGYVQIVSDRLAKNCQVYDKVTFESGMKTIDEIFIGLNATDLFVFFISESALQSEWVIQEILGAKSREADGIIRRIYPLIIDENITHKDLRIPQWMKDSYNLRLVSRPAVAVRLIQQRLRELSWDDHPRLAERKKIFVGRHEQVNAIEERFNDFDKPTPCCIIASGVPSVGRRSVLRHAIRKATSVPRDSYEPTHILLTLQDGIEDFIIKVYDVGFSDTISLEGLLDKSLEEKLEIAVLLCRDIIKANELLLIEDNGCIVTYDRCLSKWFKELSIFLSGSRSVFAVIASRYRPDFPEIRGDLFFHVQVPELTPNERMGLFKRLSDFESLNLSSETFSYFGGVLTGYPEQIQYLVALIRENGLRDAQNRIHLLTEFNSNKASVLVGSIVQDNSEDLEFLVLLSEFEFISWNLLEKFIDLPRMGNVIDRFIGAALCEQLGSNKEYIRVNDIIRDYVRRLKIGIPDRYKRILTEHARNFISNCTPEEVDASDYIFSLQRALLNGEVVPYRFLVPSHFLKAIKELYDQYRNYKDVIRLADQVINASRHLGENIMREIRYYLCLSLARSNNRRFLTEVQHITGCEKNFLLGFYYRIVGRVTDAISQQKQAILEPRVASRARRELVQLYVAIEDFKSALALAEKNHEGNPNNQYHIDSLVKCLINREDWETFEDRIRLLIDSLSESKSDRSQEMHLNLKAQFYAYCLKDYIAAHAYIEEAIANHPNNPYPHFTKLTILFRQKDLEGVNQALVRIKQLLKNDRQFQDVLVKMEAQKLALSGQSGAAVNLIDEKLHHVPGYAKKILYRRIDQLTVSGVCMDPEEYGVVNEIE